MGATESRLCDPAHEAVRLPPQSVESEQSVLGGLLLDNTAWERVTDILRADDFYGAAHREIFRAIARLLESGQPADALTAAEALERCGKLVDIGGRDYLGAIVANTLSAANIGRYAEIVRECAARRSIITRANEAIEACAAPGGGSAADITARLEQALADLTTRRQREEATTFGDALSDVIVHVDELYHGGNGMAGIATGFIDLDRMTGGLQGGDLVILAGRPGMGKTAMAMNIAQYVSREAGPVRFFSLEMNRRQLAMRVLSGHARVPMNKLRIGQVSEEQWGRISEASGTLHGLPIAMDDTSTMTCAHIRAGCRRMKRESGLSLIVVDYLQLMRGEGDNRTQEVGSISRGLKAIAKDLDVPVIALSQLSRRVDERNDKRPMLSDLRDSGEIEQDADLIAFVYRDEVYRPDSPAKGTAELLIRKQRNGPTGDIRLTFLEETMRFENYAGAEIHFPPAPRSRSRGFDYKTAQADGERVR